MFRFEDMIPLEAKVVMRGISRGYTARNFSKKDLKKSHLIFHATTSEKKVCGKGKYHGNFDLAIFIRDKSQKAS